MRVPFEWLKEFIDITATPEETAETLTMIGLEIEGAEEIEGDVVFEVNVTPNRPDCLSILGIARELSAALRLPLTVPSHAVEGEQPASGFSIEIADPELCGRYAGRLIKGVSIGDSPLWMKSRLEKCGVRAINSVVDITNYLLLEFGHPLHAFDADTLTGRKIRVATAGEGGKITTLDGVERDLPEESLLIMDAEKPVAIAGVMGGQNTEVTEGTVHVFLESAYFAPASVRRTSKKTGLSTESSYRFERGTDIEFLEKALDRASSMISAIAGGTVCRIDDEYPSRYSSLPVEARYDRINRLLGTNLAGDEMADIMERLSIPVERHDASFLALPPPFRRDIQIENDIAEEVARIHGFGNIGTTLPRSPLSSAVPGRDARCLNSVKQVMRSEGFTEAINYSFMSPSGPDLLELPPDDRRRRSVAISNPLSQEGSLLRTMLAPSLIENLTRNLDRGMKSIRLFETGKVCIGSSEPLPEEELKLGGIFYREKTPALWKEEAPPFYIVKGSIETLLDELRVEDCSFLPSQEPFLHQGKSADIYSRSGRLGYLGILSPGTIERLDLKKQNPEIVLFEVDLNLLFAGIPDSLRYVPVPKYPSVERDVAVIVDEGVQSSAVLKLIRDYPSALIEDASVFDAFKGGSIPSGKKSLAFNIVYRSREKTLTDEEVEAVHSSLVSHILLETGGEPRK
jgi:phenylalanyl-tRNA synthetase beta chain